MKAALNPRCHFLDGAGFSQSGCTFNQQVAIGQQRQHQFVNKIVLANNLLRQPVFQVREGLIVHGAGLNYCSVRNSIISDHYKT